jgi:hypothetical protein
MSQLQEYYDMAYAIALTGEKKFNSIHGRYRQVFVKTIDEFEYRADENSQDVEVMNIENYDPFISRWASGNPCRCHLGRYNSIEKIEQHFESLSKGGE